MSNMRTLMEKAGFPFAGQAVGQKPGDQVRGSEPMPKKGGGKKHPYAGRLVGGASESVDYPDADSLKEEYDQYVASLSEDLPPPENARKTQIASTLGTYKKAGAMLDKAGIKGKSLDFGAGLGKGTAELGKDAESYEPYPREDFKPHYIDATKIPSNSYSRIVNLNVLNVVPNVEGHRIRDEIVRQIGRVLAPGGMALITTRGRDVLTIKGTPGEEPMSMISSIGTYQKGFTNAELKEYVQSVLGDNFDVSSAKLGPAGVMIKKHSETLDEEYMAEYGAAGSAIGNDVSTSPQEQAQLRQQQVAQKAEVQGQVQGLLGQVTSTRSQIAQLNKSFPTGANPVEKAMQLKDMETQKVQLGRQIEDLMQQIGALRQQAL